MAKLESNCGEDQDTQSTRLPRHSKLSLTMASQIVSVSRWAAQFCHLIGCTCQAQSPRYKPPSRSRTPNMYNRQGGWKEDGLTQGYPRRSDIVTFLEAYITNERTTRTLFPDSGMPSRSGFLESIIEVREPPRHFHRNWMKSMFEDPLDLLRETKTRSFPQSGKQELFSDSLLVCRSFQLVASDVWYGELVGVDSSPYVCRSKRKSLNWIYRRPTPEYRDYIRKIKTGDKCSSNRCLVSESPILVILTWKASFSNSRSDKLWHIECFEAVP